jgi:FAD/FMN-containing dehydrogenase
MSPSGSTDLQPELVDLIGVEAVMAPPPHRYLNDETETRGLEGRAEAVVLPRSAEEAASVVAFAYERDLVLTPRDGGTGTAWASSSGTPFDLYDRELIERMRAVRSVFDLKGLMNPGTML